MIKQMGREDERIVLQQAMRWPATGPMLGMFWQLQKQNPRLPGRFFQVSGGGVLCVYGWRAVLCGRVDNPDEISEFLLFENIVSLVALDFFPPGWKLHGAETVMVRAAAPFEKPEIPLGLDTWPPMREVMRVLESNEGPLGSEEERNQFYADGNTRRNHNAAKVLGLWDGGRLASTASGWSVTEWETYVACVETRPQHQGKGYASALLRQLCYSYQDRDISLLCRKELCGFYAPFGFQPVGPLGLIAVNPQLLKENAKET